MLRISSAVKTGVSRQGIYRRRCLHTSVIRSAVTNFQMPAMSPTMTEGGIAQWKLKEGDTFSTGDVLLEIETDKATIDVEAQDDGILAKILSPDGAKNISVGQVIALLAEEGDDISNLEAPKSEQTFAKEVSPPTPPPSTEPEKPKAKTENVGHYPTPLPIPGHSRPLFPSVHRLLAENHVENLEKIKGTGVRGMLTKGDVLAYLGKASGPMGTFKEPAKQEVKVQKEESKALDGPSLRRLIVSTLLQNSTRAQKPLSAPTDFDSVVLDYLPMSKLPPVSKPSSFLPRKQSTAEYFDGLL